MARILSSGRSVEIGRKAAPDLRMPSVVTMYSYDGSISRATSSFLVIPMACIAREIESLSLSSS